PNVQRTFKTITSDNGSEFSELSEQGKEWKIDVYFAHPYASWERGSNERHNGLIRRFIKKVQPIHRYSDEQIDRVAEWMNTLPRKILDYLTPNEAFAQFIEGVASTTHSINLWQSLYIGINKSVALINEITALHLLYIA